MTFTEKLKLLGADKNKARAAREVGLGETVISTYIAKGSIPRADIALKIARALNVPLDWLADDEQDYPPPVASIRSPADFSDDELMKEVARRYRLQAIRLLKWLEPLERIDWKDAALKLYKTPFDSPLPKELSKLAQTLWYLKTGVHFSRTMYDPKVYADLHGDQMPGGEVTEATLDINGIFNQLVQWANDNRDFGLVEKYTVLRDGFTHAESKRKTEAEAERKAILKTLEKSS